MKRKIVILAFAAAAVIAVICFALPHSAAGKNTIEYKNFESIATIRIDTENGVLPTYELYEKSGEESALLGQGIINNAYVSCIATLSLGSETQTVSGKIRIRGNTSAQLDKKPYRLKLEEENGFIFPGNSCGDIVLLSEDGASLKYPIASFIAGQLGVEWQPDYRYANVFINGEYQGLYLAVESVSEGVEHLDIADDGFLVENDPYWYEEDIYVRPRYAKSNYYAYTFKSNPDAGLVEAFGNYFEKVQSDLYSGNMDAYPDEFDFRSFASWLLTQEVLSNGDGAGSNTYMYIRSLENDYQIRFGPIWDTWQCFASVEGRSAKYGELQVMGLDDFLYAEEFREEFKELWYENEDCLLSAVSRMLDGMDLEELAEAYRYDNELWGGSADPYVQKEEALSFLAKRIVWLEDNIGSYDPITVSRDGNTFTVFYASGNAGDLHFAVWSEKDSQDDLVWYDACSSEGKSCVTFDLTDHVDGEDNLIVHIYSGDELLTYAVFRVIVSDP